MSVLSPRKPVRRLLPLRSLTIALSQADVWVTCGVGQGCLLLGRAVGAFVGNGHVGALAGSAALG